VLHARVAQVLVEEFPETADAQPEWVAHHFQAANDVDNAVAFLVKAAKLSARRSGFAESISQLEAALALLAVQPKSSDRLRLALIVHRTLGGIYAEYRGFSSADCGRAYNAALDLCRELGDAPEIFSVLSGLGSFEITRAAFGKCEALADECLSRAAAQQSKPPFIMGHLLLGGTLFLKGELAAAREHLEEGLRVYERDQTARRARQVLYVQDQKSTGLCYLALSLTATAGVFLALDAEFLAAVQLLLYAGGVVTIAVFAIVVTERLVGDRITQTSRYLASGAVVAGALYAAVAATVRGVPLPAAPPLMSGDVTRAIGEALLTRFVLPFELLGVLALAALLGALYFARPDE
jgi:NADH:ubiquinone oxidoreductase subunit 6 (subunit J)